MTQGIKSHGTLIAIGDGQSPEAFTKIDEATAIPAIGGGKGLIDMSNHDSVGYKEYFVADLADGDEINVECNEIPGNPSQELVRAADAVSAQKNWKVTYRDGTTEVFAGVITKLHTDAGELDGRVKFTFSVKIAGDVVRTVAPA